MSGSRAFGSSLLVAEAVRGLRSQPVQAVLTMLVVAAMGIAVLLTSGRAEGAREAVLGRLDSPSIRTVVVRTDPSLGLSSSLATDLAQITDIEWVGAFGASQDVRNAGIPGGEPVSVRSLWTKDGGPLRLPTTHMPQSAWASPRALQVLGMDAAAGGLVRDDGAHLSVAGALHVPEYLSDLEPLVVVPRPADEPGDLTMIVAVASSPHTVTAVRSAIEGILGAPDPRISISTREGLLNLRDEVGGQLGSFNRALVASIVAVSGLIVGILLYSLVLLRRKDFGRRRALGARRSWIVQLLIVQTFILCVIGAAVGTVVASIALSLSGAPMPPIGFFAAVNTLAVGIGCIACLPPSIAAARRDPLVELRTP